MGDIDEQNIERRKGMKRLGAMEETEESKNSQQLGQMGGSKSKGINKMRAVYDAVKALRGMQKCFPGLKKAGGLLGEPETRDPSTTVGTLQYLDEPEDTEEIERKEFEELAKNYGKIIHYLGVGESFGEIALKKNSPRTAGILCRKDCEFLTLEKQQFDDVFGKIEKEKELFLTSVFPILTSFSSANYNYLVCFFKTERFGKGSYIITEGIRAGPKAKFYVIQSGECVLEKRMTRKQNDPYNLKQTFSAFSDNVQIAVAGKGSIVGEEIIDAQEAYEYSVKAISENVIVQAITKKDFKHRFPRDFQEYVASVYETKQSHRETIISNLKKDDQSNVQKGNNAHPTNTTVPHLATKSAQNCFNRYIQRENKLDSSSFLRTIVSPRAQQSSYRESSLTSAREHLATEGMKETLPLAFRGPTQEDEMGQLKTERTAKGDRVTMKIEFLNRVASPPRNTASDEDGALENAKFFTQMQNDKDRKVIKVRLAQVTKQYKGEKRVPSDMNRPMRDSSDFLVNKFMHRKEDFEYLHQRLTNNPGPQEGENGKPIVNMPKSLNQSRRSSKTGSIQDLNSLYNQKILKGRPSARPISPVPIGHSEGKPESLNNLSSKEYLMVKKPEMKPGKKHFRKLSSMGLSSKTLRTYADAERGKRNENDEDNENRAPSLRRLTSEDEKEMIMNNLVEKERAVLQERAGNANENNKKKGSQGNKLATWSKAQVGKGENNIYAHLNEMKEWRLKVFRKPNKQAMAASTMRTLSASKTIAVEGKSQVEG